VAEEAGDNWENTMDKVADVMSIVGAIVFVGVFSLPAVGIAIKLFYYFLGLPSPIIYPKAGI
jgi:hypothetical protein